MSSPEIQRVPDLITNLQRFTPFSSLQGTGCWGGGAAAPARSPDESRPIHFEGKKSFLINKSQMNMNVLGFLPEQFIG